MFNVWCYGRHCNIEDVQTWTLSDDMDIVEICMAIQDEVPRIWQCHCLCFVMGKGQERGVNMVHMSICPHWVCCRWFSSGPSVDFCTPNIAHGLAHNEEGVANRRDKKEEGIESNLKRR
jgi:hypothetical protein